MKKWTVMLIPHDRGSSRTMHLSAYQLWLIVAVLAALSFSTTYFCRRHQMYVGEVARLQKTTHEAEAKISQDSVAVKNDNLTAQERIELEKRIRAEYEARDAAITTRLNDLKELEDQARAMTGLSPRRSLKDLALTASSGGKGGGASSFEEIAHEEPAKNISSPSVIYGLSQPSADLIIQEINLRSESLQQLVSGLKARAEQVSHVPSIWPSFAGNRSISSSFGFRKDPCGFKIVHHDGMDITAPYGSDVRATAKGVVTFSGFDSGGLGNLVKIDHGNGIETWYGHMSALKVKVGEVVERKQTIGALGSTGRSTGPHIHYEIHVHDRAVDPAKYLTE